MRVLVAEDEPRLTLQLERALAAAAPVEITGVEAVATSFPGFIETLESCVER